jgi:hypothetical protein
MSCNFTAMKNVKQTRTSALGEDPCCLAEKKTAVLAFLWFFQEC